MKFTSIEWAAFFLLVLTAIAKKLNAYNLDTKFPVVFRGQPGSYFGYSVALHRNRDGAMALIGAPRANSSFIHVYAPGALYRCDVEKHNSCLEVALDTKHNSRVQDANKMKSYYEMKDGMWLGVSLDVQQSLRNDVVVCGHLWRNQLHKKVHLTNGVCYIINGDLDPSDVRKLLPMVERSKMTKNKYDMGQVGTSASFSEDGQFLLLGAPGYYFWTGNVVSYELGLGRSSREYTRADIPALHFDHKIPVGAYMGYSVTSGKFFDSSTEYVAVGGPRDGGLNGRVYVYDPLKSATNRYITVQQRMEGSQLCEYFGASVLGLDINNDGYTDLLVGAPLYSSDYGVDEGKVYVFLGNSMGLQTYRELFGEGKSYARFGTAIADLGDINQDGYRDLAIGAPYEDKSGVVYIYHGSASGLSTNYIQRISAIEVDSTLVGFGIRISRGLDVDSNLYPDMLVGSYGSDAAVLFKTRPIQQLYATISFSPKRINMNEKKCNFRRQDIPCVNITACLWYAGKHIPLQLEFQHYIFIELNNRISPRGFFILEDRATKFKNHTSQIKFETNYCFKSSLHIQSDIKDKVTPIQITYRYHVVEKDINKFNKTLPLTDKKSSNEYVSSIAFQIGCGSDEKCQSDLSVSAIVLGNKAGNTFIIGEKPSINVVIETVNLGEPAYLSELFIHLPPELPSINHGTCLAPVSDHQGRNESLVCDIGNPLHFNKTTKTEIKLDLTKVLTDRRELSLVFEAVTASNDINLTNNRISVPLHFNARADIGITGKPDQEQILYNRFSKEASQVVISHTYFVRNYGPSPVQIIDISLFVPSSFRGSGFVTFTSIESESGKLLFIPVTCNDSYIELNPYVRYNSEDTFEEYGEENNNESNTFIDDRFEPRIRRKRGTKENIRKKKQRNTGIDCESAKCVAIQCSASPFLTSRKFAKITLALQLNMSRINSVQKEWDRLEFVTSGSVKIRNKNNFLEPKPNLYPDRTNVKTVLVSSARPAPEEPSNWIIFASIAIGLLVWLIILVLLIRFGFFKRKRKELMDKIKRETAVMHCEPVLVEDDEQEVLD